MKFVSLISSGIDSPVATFLLAKSAEEIILVHGDIRPFIDDREIENFKKLVKHLQKVVPGKIKVYLTPHGTSLYEFKQNCNNRYTCIFCKRMLLRSAEKIAEKEGADVIVMGDSLGQVASQTIKNIRVVDQAVNIPVLRPLIGFDKEDIIKIARDIGTYEISIQPSLCCTIVPKKPATSAKLEDVLKEEEKVDIGGMVKESLKNIKTTF